MFSSSGNIDIDYGYTIPLLANQLNLNELTALFAWRVTNVYHFITQSNYANTWYY